MIFSRSFYLTEIIYDYGDYTGATHNRIRDSQSDSYGYYILISVVDQQKIGA